MKSVTKRAYAKINLHLDITGVLDDGYHSVNNVMQSVSLYDEVTLTLRHDNTVNVACDKTNVPTGADNLASKAISAFSAKIGETLGADVYIQKNIPMAAGLAGGSADAAATLLALNELFGSPLSTEELCLLGGKLGADIPFCIVGGTAFAEGKGDVLRPFPQMPDCTVVIACGGEGVSTPWAFRKLDGLYNGFVSDVFYSPRSLSPLCEAMQGSNIEVVARNIYNIFEQPILAERPVAANLRRVMLSSGALGAMMSGSGPSVYGIFTDEACVSSACEKIRRLGVEPHVCKPIN